MPGTVRTPALARWLRVFPVWPHRVLPPHVARRSVAMQLGLLILLLLLLIRISTDYGNPLLCDHFHVYLLGQLENGASFLLPFRS